MNITDVLMINLNELQIEMAILKAEFAKTKERLDHLEATVNHEE